MKTPVRKIRTHSPATFIIDTYRMAAVNHINGALNTIVANHEIAPAIMATAAQLYEDLQHLKLIGLISDREYDAAAAIAFDVICGDFDARLSLPPLVVVHNEDGDKLHTLREGEQIVRQGIMMPINKCLGLLVNADETVWREDGWENEEEYHKFLLHTIHNIMRIGTIVGATTEAEHDKVSDAITRCVTTKIAEPVVLEDVC